MIIRKKYDGTVRREFVVRVRVVLTVFLVGVSSGCAVSKSPNEPPSARTQNPSSEATQKVADGTEGSSTNPAMTAPTQGMNSIELEEKQPELTAAEILAQTNVTPRRSFEDSEKAGDVGKSDLLGWQHRVFGIDLIDKGEWDLARKHLQWAEELMNNPAQASDILVQLDADPVAYLGADSVSYRVAKNDTLGDLAQRFLNDSLKFPILARYNAIDVPMALEPGTVIQIPSAYDTGTDTAPVPTMQGTVKQPKAPSQDEDMSPPAKPADSTVAPTVGSDELPAEDVQSPSTAEPEAISNVAESVKALYNRVTFHYQRGELEQAKSLNDQILSTDDSYVPAVLMRQRIEQGLK